MSSDKILAIETATNICSVCYQDEEGVVYEKRTNRKGSHSELLFLFIRELMTEHGFTLSELNALLVSAGPGSYTGLRIAASAVKGMLYELNVPVFAGNTLAGFAAGLNKGRIHAVINARRKHLYYQCFKSGKSLKSMSKTEILELEQVEKRLKKGDQIIGTGLERLSEHALKGLTIVDSGSISAKGLIRLFNGASRDDYFSETTPEKLESNYLTSSQVNNTKI